MKGHLRIICAEEAAGQTAEKLDALLKTLNLNVCRLQDPEPYWKVSGQCVINCDFDAESVDTDSLAQELRAFSGAQAPEVLCTQQDCQIGCYNSAEALQENPELRFTYCYIVF